jgi:hypothetical protein
MELLSAWLEHCCRASYRPDSMQAKPPGPAEAVHQAETLKPGSLSSGSGDQVGCAWVINPSVAAGGRLFEATAVPSGISRWYKRILAFHQVCLS